jgi:hypothetical protein
MLHYLRFWLNIWHRYPRTQMNSWTVIWWRGCWRCCWRSTVAFGLLITLTQDHIPDGSWTLTSPPFFLWHLPHQVLEWYFASRIEEEISTCFRCSSLLWSLPNSLVQDRPLSYTPRSQTFERPRNFNTDSVMVPLKFRGYRVQGRDRRLKLDKTNSSVSTCSFNVWMSTLSVVRTNSSNWQNQIYIGGRRWL